MTVSPSVCSLTGSSVATHASTSLSADATPMTADPQRSRDIRWGVDKVEQAASVRGRAATTRGLVAGWAGRRGRRRDRQGPGRVQRPVRGRAVGTADTPPPAGELSPAGRPWSTDGGVPSAPDNSPAPHETARPPLLPDYLPRSHGALARRARGQVPGELVAAAVDGRVPSHGGAHVHGRAAFGDTDRPIEDGDRVTSGGCRSSCADQPSFTGIPRAHEAPEACVAPPITPRPCGRPSVRGLGSAAAGGADCRG